MHVWLPLIRTGTGSETYTRRLAEGLRHRGHFVSISEVAHGFQYAPWLAPISPPNGVDVILANSWNAAAFSRYGVPVVSVCHLVVHDERLTPYKTEAQRLFHRQFVLRMETAANRRAAVNVAVSPMVARQMKRIFGAERVVTVNNGVDTDYFSPATAREKRPGEPFRLLFVGKPSLRKGFDIVTRIVARLRDKVQFTSAGAEPAAHLPRPPGIYTGMLDRAALREAYRSADLLLFPSRMEGLSLAVAEAMACGLPILTCEGSGTDDFIPPDGGIVRPESDIEGFVDQIERVMRDPVLDANMRKISRDLAVERFSEERWVCEMADVLGNACSRASPSFSATPTKAD